MVGLRGWGGYSGALLAEQGGLEGTYCVFTHILILLSFYLVLLRPALILTSLEVLLISVHLSGCFRLLSTLYCFLYVNPVTKILPLFHLLDIIKACNLSNFDCRLTATAGLPRWLLVKPLQTECYNITNARQNHGGKTTLQPHISANSCSLLCTFRKMLFAACHELWYLIRRLSRSDYAGVVHLQAL